MYDFCSLNLQNKPLPTVAESSECISSQKFKNRSKYGDLKLNGLRRDQAPMSASFKPASLSIHAFLHRQKIFRSLKEAQRSLSFHLTASFLKNLWCVFGISEFTFKGPETYRYIFSSIICDCVGIANDI